MRTVVAKGLASLVLLAMTSGPAAADWLVTRAGARVETRGAWRITGRVVVFSALNGRLSSLRLADVDLEASEALTAAGGAVETAAKPPAAPAPRHVITGKDVGRYYAPRPSAETAGQKAPEASPAPASVPLRVTSWQRVEAADFNGFEIVGSVRNDGRNVIARIEVEVSLYKNDGSLAGSWHAFLDHDVLPAGRSTRFRLPVSADHWAANDARFELHGEEQLVRLSGGAPSAEGR